MFEMKSTIYCARDTGLYLPDDKRTGPVDIWPRTINARWSSIKAKKASWLIYNHKFEDLNPYTNGIRDKRPNSKKIRVIMNKAKAI